MTTDAAALPALPPRAEGLVADRVLPVVTVVAVIVALWYAAAVWLNAPRVIERLEGDSIAWTARDLLQGTWSMDRPVLPAPHQIAEDLYQTVFKTPVQSKRSLVYHAGVTVSATVLGFLFGSLLGIVLAVGIVHLTVLDRSLLPWVIASQTVPILAIAPMVVVVLGNLGLSGLLPKAIISMYLCFFPVDHRHGQGAALARSAAARPDAHLQRDAGAGVLEAALAGGDQLSVRQPQGRHRRQPGGCHRRRVAHGRPGRDRRPPAERVLLRPDHPDLVGADRRLRRRGGAGGAGRRRSSGWSGARRERQREAPARATCCRWR